MKNCLWCKEPIPKERMRPSQYKAITCHAGSCATSYRWHKCSKDEIKPLPDRFCPLCGEKLVRREFEKSQAWGKRVYCNKSHKAFHDAKGSKPDLNKSQGEPDKSGVKIYKRGSEEFNRIAALYEGRC